MPYLLPGARVRSRYILPVQEQDTLDIFHVFFVIVLHK